MASRKNLRNFIGFTAAVVMVASAAARADARYSATLAQPVAKKMEFIVNSNLFRCEETTCVLGSAPIDVSSLHNCRALQHKVGPLTSYVADGKAFDADKLAKCNAAS